MPVDATMYLWGDCLVPDELTSLLGATPTKALQKGDKLSAASGLPSIARTGMWSLCTANFVHGNRIPDHLKFLVDNFSEKISILRNDHKVDKVRVSVIISPETISEDVSSWNDEIPADALNAIANMGGSLALTVLFPLTALGT